jgi:hypothetical protein
MGKPVLFIGTSSRTHQYRNWRSYSGLTYAAATARGTGCRVSSFRYQQSDPTLLKRQPVLAFHWDFRFIVRSCGQFLLAAAPADM